MSEELIAGLSWFVPILSFALVVTAAVAVHVCRRELRDFKENVNRNLIDPPIEPPCKDTSDS